MEAFLHEISIAADRVFDSYDLVVSHMTLRSPGPLGNREPKTREQ